MSEPTQDPDRESPSIDPERLRMQAEELRQQGYKPTTPLPKGPSRARDVIYAILLILIVGSVLWLLISSNSRVRLIRGIAGAWTNVYRAGEKAEVYKLPPPPPKAVEPKVILQGSPTFAYRSAPPPAPAPGETGVQGDNDEQSAETESKPPAPPEKTAGTAVAYEFLIKKSDVARRLSTNNFPGYRFKEWKPVRNAAPEFWVDLIAVTPAGQEVHFIWLANPEADNVKPLSQEARDLERK